MRLTSIPKGSHFVVVACVSAIATFCIVLLSGALPQSGNAADMSAIHVTSPKVLATPQVDSVPDNSPDLILPVPVRAACAYCGTIESINAVSHISDTHAGVAAGAIIGGLLCNQSSDSRVHTLATLAGAIGSSHEADQHAHTQTTYQINVRMDNGSLQSLTRHTIKDWHTGDLVRLDQGTLKRRP